MKKKVFSIMLLCTFFFITFNCNPIFAALDGDYYQTQSEDQKIDKSNPDGIIQGAKGFVEEGEEQVEAGQTINSTKLKETSNFIYNLLLAIAMIIAMAIGVVIGIKYMIASASEKADTKELLVPYVAGCIVVFGAMGIWKLLVTIFAEF